MQKTDMLTDKQAARVLHKSARTVRLLRSTGKLAFMPGRPPLIPRQALNDYIARATISPLPHPVIRQVRLIPSTRH